MGLASLRRPRPVAVGPSRAGIESLALGRRVGARGFRLHGRAFEAGDLVRLRRRGAGGRPQRLGISLHEPEHIRAAPSVDRLEQNVRRLSGGRGIGDRRDQFLSSLGVARAIQQSDERPRPPCRFLLSGRPGERRLGPVRSLARLLSVEFGRQRLDRLGERLEGVGVGRLADLIEDLVEGLGRLGVGQRGWQRPDRLGERLERVWIGRLADLVEDGVEGLGRLGVAELGRQRLDRQGQAL